VASTALQRDALEIAAGERELWSAESVAEVARRPLCAHAVRDVTQEQRDLLMSRAAALRTANEEHDRSRDVLADRRPGEAIQRARRRSRQLAAKAEDRRLFLASLGEWYNELAAKCWQPF
jgi:hypothetical protein